MKLLKFLTVFLTSEFQWGNQFLPLVLTNEPTSTKENTCRSIPRAHLNIFRELAKPTITGFHMVLYPGQIGSLCVGFCEGRKTREPGENFWNRVRTKNKLNPHLAQGQKLLNPATLVGLRRALLPQDHSCFPQQYCHDILRACNVHVYV